MSPMFYGKSLIFQGKSENPFGGLRAFQNGFARTRSDADASTHKKGARRHADASDEANADR